MRLVIHPGTGTVMDSNELFVLEVPDCFEQPDDDNYESVDHLMVRLNDLIRTDT
jgi:hypothetical protein